MSDPIRKMYEQRKRANAALNVRLGLASEDEDEQDDETQQSAPKPSDIDQGNRGGPASDGDDRSTSQRASDFLRAAYRKTKTGSQSVAVDMNDKWLDDE